MWRNKMIQLYEQRKQDIKKARAETVARLAGTLGCEVEDLLEWSGMELISNVMILIWRVMGLWKSACSMIQ